MALQNDNPYKSPATASNPPDDESDRQLSTVDVRRALLFAAVQQVILLVLAALTLDFGEMLNFVVYVSLGHWLVVLLMMIRGWNRPTKLHLVFIRYGFWMMALVVAVVRWIVY